MANTNKARKDRNKQIYASKKSTWNNKENKHWVKKQETKGFLEDKKFEKKIKMMMKAGK